MSVTDWGSFGKASVHYSSLGYEEVEVPWLVSESSIEVTKPKHARTFKTWAGHLVASGEQSFLEVRNRLEGGKRYQCITPCFRDEPIQNEMHRTWFVKLELIRVLHEGQMPSMQVEEIADQALSLFTQMVPGGDFRVVETEDGLDIELNGVEVGSYGYREDSGFRWIYGTGLAQPRFAMARDLVKKHQTDDAWRCWYCNLGGSMHFSTEFDTPVHLDCVAKAHQEDENDREAAIMYRELLEHGGEN